MADTEPAAHERIDHSKGWRCASCRTYAHLFPQSLTGRADLLDQMWNRHTDPAESEASR